MSGSPRRAPRWLDVVLIVATVAAAIVLVRWADQEYLRVETPFAYQVRTVNRPEWVWALQRPYQRLQHGWPWFCVAATLGAGAILACDRETWTRRRLSRPGTTVVFVVILLGALTAAHQAFLAPTFTRSNGICYSVSNGLNFRLPGAILGVWVVGWLRPHHSKPDWPERAGRMVGWMWLANVGLLIGYGVLFG